MTLPLPADLPAAVYKRDGRMIDFDIARIERAMTLCYRDLGTESATPIAELVSRVAHVLSAKYLLPTVEQIQDAVEQTLLGAGEYAAARHYILYREEHAKARAERPIDPAVRAAFDASKLYFPTPIQEFQFYDKYSRWNDAAQRRETWIETVDRSVAFLHELAGDRLEGAVYERIRQAILRMEALPSMRLLALAGPAARRSHITIYNCSYQAVDALDAFVEALIISMSGCGVGYSVERQYVEKLPRIKRQRTLPALRYTVEDSSEGWADALRFGLYAWFEGADVLFDLSLIRPAGAPLRTKGGTASGPEPLRSMLTFCRKVILNRQGGVLRPIDAHDMMCAVGQGAVSGGMRRTAMIALFDHDDQEMRLSKSPANLAGNEQRWNANNSVVWPQGGLTQLELMRQFLEMAEAGTGEPGIFNREAANALKPTWRRDAEFGTNPCGEINLRPMEFCNLTAAVARAHDTESDLRAKIELATIIGTIQSLATTFPGLRPQWAANCEEERLLGVDLTGQMDSPAAQDPAIRARLREHATMVNREVALQLGINPSASVTCVKPSGNSSQLVNCASGLHARWAPYYLRRVRVGANTPMHAVLKDAGVPMSPENGQTADTATTWVVSFPMRAPQGAVTRKDRTAVQQLEHWLLNKQVVDHNPSCTITYQPHELLDVVAWVYAHQHMIGGLSFLPADDHAYAQAPYEEISPEEYQARLAAFPPIDFSKIVRYETTDRTTAAQELACVSGACEVELVPTT
jgi:ribonucleoside-triphosphate reductase